MSKRFALFISSKDDPKVGWDALHDIFGSKGDAMRHSREHIAYDSDYSSGGTYQIVDLGLACVVNFWSWEKVDGEIRAVESERPK